MEFNGLAGQMRYFALQGSGYDVVQDERPGYWRKNPDCCPAHYDATILQANCKDY